MKMENIIPKRGRPPKENNKTSKNCFYINCKSYSRNGTSLSEVVFTDHNYHIQPSSIKFYAFQKPCLRFRKGDPTHDELVCNICLKAIKWLRNCGRLDTLDCISNNRYVCSIHFKDSDGPTKDNPYPMPFSAAVLCSDSSDEPTEVNIATNNFEEPVIETNISNNNTEETELFSGENLYSAATRKRKLYVDEETENIQTNFDDTELSIFNDEHSPDRKRKLVVDVPSLPKSSTPCKNHIANFSIPTTTSEQSFNDNSTHTKDKNQRIRFKSVGVSCKPRVKNASTHTTVKILKSVESECSIRLKGADKNTQTGNGLLEENKKLKLKVASLNEKLANCICGKNGKMAKFNSFESKIRNNSKMCLFYTGLYFSQILSIFEFLGPAVSKLNYWTGKKANESKIKKYGRDSRFSPLQQLIITLIRLRCGLLEQDIAYRFDLGKSTVNSFVTTWIVFMYKEFQLLKSRMFPSRAVVRANLPICFRNHKDVRVIIDCTEFHTESPSNFSEQGNMYSNYKSNTTFKVLFGISPTGAITFISKAFEGAISDREIFLQSGLKDLLEEGDCVMADRGFTIADYLLEKKATLNIPPFLHGRDTFTPQEELQTKEIAKLRIYVEHSIGRIKRWRIFKKKIPLAMKGIFSELVFVIGCLVNFQTPVVKY